MTDFLDTAAQAVAGVDDCKVNCTAEPIYTPSDSWLLTEHVHCMHIGACPAIQGPWHSLVHNSPVLRAQQKPCLEGYQLNDFTSGTRPAEATQITRTTCIPQHDHSLQSCPDSVCRMLISACRRSVWFNSAMTRVWRCPWGPWTSRPLMPLSGPW